MTVYIDHFHDFHDYFVHSSCLSKRPSASDALNSIMIRLLFHTKLSREEPFEADSGLQDANIKFQAV